MEYMHELKEKLCDELEEISHKPDMNAGDLEMVHKLTDTIKNIDKISMLEEDGGYSQAPDWEIEGRAYNRGNSYRGRKRDSMGRYSREGRDGYSRDGYARDGYARESRMYSREDGKERMMEEMQSLMAKAGSEKEREAIRRCMSQLENA